MEAEVSGSEGTGIGGWKPPFWVISAIKYGTLVGLFNVLFYGMLYLINLELIFSWIIQIMINLLNIAFYILSAMVIRRQNRNILPFKQAFSVIFIVLLASGFIFIVFQYLQFNVIQPEMAVEYQEAKVEQTVNMMERFNMEQDQIDEEVSRLKSVNTFGLNQLFWSFCMNSVLGGAILALIIGAFVKRKEPLIE